MKQHHVIICLLLPIFLLWSSLTFAKETKTTSEKEEEQIEEEFADLLEGRAASKQQKVLVSHLLKLFVHKADFLKIRDHGDIYPLVQHLLKNSSPEKLEAEDEKKLIDYYTIAIDQEIVDDLIKKVKAGRQAKGFFGKLNTALIKKNLPPLLASSGLFAVLSGIICPFILAPIYSYLTHYKYGLIPLDEHFLPVNRNRSDQEKNMLTLLIQLRLVTFQLEERVEHGAFYGSYLILHIAMNVLNSLIGIFAPPGSILGGMKLGAVIGAIYYFGFSNWSSAFLRTISSVIHLPNWIAYKTIGRLTSLHQKIDRFFYKRKYIPIKIKKEGTNNENNQKE